MIDISSVQASWKSVHQFVYVPQSDQDYDTLSQELFTLLDKGAGNSDHPLNGLALVLIALLQQYESTTGHPSLFNETTNEEKMVIAASLEDFKLGRYAEEVHKTHS